MSDNPKNKIYDIIIAGGGISGLYTAYKLIKNYPMLSILIIEKNNYLGGRIKSTVIEGQRIDLGALRIPYSAKLTIELVKDLGLKLKKFNNKTKSIYIRQKLYVKNKFHKSQERFFLPSDTPINQSAFDLLLETILKSLNIDNIEKIKEDQKIGLEKICNISTYNFLKTKLSQEQLSWIIESTAIRNSELCLNLFNFCSHVLINKNYFVIKTRESEFGNMSELIINLDQKTSKIDKLLNKKINSISYNENELFWNIEVLDDACQKAEVFKSKIFISTIPIFALHDLKVKIKNYQKWQKILDLFIHISKGRYYLQYEYKWWIQNSGEFIHPVNERSWILSPKSNIILASYCDVDKINLFKSLTDQELSNILHSGLCELFNIDEKNTPKPIKIIKAEWDSPDNYVCSKIIPAKYNKEKLETLMQPFQDKSFFIISDTITNNSGWIESALSSSEKSLPKIISIIKNM